MYHIPGDRDYQGPVTCQKHTDKEDIQSDEGCQHSGHNKSMVGFMIYSFHLWASYSSMRNLSMELEIFQAANTRTCVMAHHDIKYHTERNEEPIIKFLYPFGKSDK